MTIKRQIIVTLVLAISFVISSCGLEQSGLLPKPTPKPFTSPVTIGAWVGDIKIPLGPDESENANIRLLIKDDKMIDYYQLYLTSCSLVAGDSSIPIDQGTFSFNIDYSCSITGTITINGVFVSEDKLEGTIKAGSQTSYWEAALAK